MIARSTSVRGVDLVCDFSWTQWINGQVSIDVHTGYANTDLPKRAADWIADAESMYAIPATPEQLTLRVGEHIDQRLVAWNKPGGKLVWRVRDPLPAGLDLSTSGRLTGSPRRTQQMTSVIQVRQQKRPKGQAPGPWMSSTIAWTIQPAGQTWTRPARVDLSPTGTALQQQSWSGRASSNGRWVAFVASDPAVGGSPRQPVVVVRDMSTGATKTLPGSRGPEPETLTISGDGRIVAFDQSYMDDSGATVDHIVRYDLATGRAGAVATADDQEARTANAHLFLSDDGRYLAFNAQLRLGELPVERAQTWRYDNETGAFELLSRGLAGQPARYGSFGPVQMSADARYVAFEAANPDDDGSNHIAVYWRDTATATTRLAAVPGNASNSGVSENSRFTVSYASGRLDVRRVGGSSPVVVQLPSRLVAGFCPLSTAWISNDGSRAVISTCAASGRDADHGQVIAVDVPSGSTSVVADSDVMDVDVSGDVTQITYDTANGAVYRASR